MKKSFRIGSKIAAIALVATLISPLASTFSITSLAIAPSKTEMSQKLDKLRYEYPDETIWNSTFDGAIQCMGFALFVDNYLFAESARYWETKGDVSDLRVGDYVRYRADTFNHSIVITNIVDDKVYYVDCNGTNSPNKINWNRETTKQELQTLIDKPLLPKTTDSDYDPGDAFTRDGKGYFRSQKDNKVTTLGSTTTSTAKAQVQASLDYTLIFNANLYSKKNEDLNKAFGTDYQKLLNHWVRYGASEGRLSSYIFDVRYYLANNQDVADMCNKTNNAYAAAYNHFLNYGYKEKRKFSPIFDMEYYLANNPDVEKVCGVEGALMHFINYGMKEGRASSKTFNAKDYASLNSDLVKAFGSSDYTAYYAHYINYGMQEGRQSISAK